MNRRDAIAAITVLTALPWSAFGAVGPVGYMDVDRWWAEGFRKRHARVLCNGVDITNGCRWFDDAKGVANCLLHDGNGDVLIDGCGDVASEMKYGQIEVVIP